MTEQQAIDRLKKRLGDKILSIANPRKRRVYLYVDKQDLVEVACFIFFEMKCRLCTSTAHEIPEGIEIIHHFYQDLERVMINLKVLAPKPDLTVPSIGAHFEAANWIEREMAEMYGVTFDGHPDPRRLLLSDDWPECVYPFRKDFDPTGIEGSRHGKRQD